MSILGWSGETEVSVGLGGGAAAAGGALEEADLHEIRFVDVLDGRGFFGADSSEGGEADRATSVVLDNGGEEAAIGGVEA